VNVCCYCTAAGVIEVSGLWYCPKHIHHALYAVAEQMVLLSQPKLDWSSSDMEETITEILHEAGYVWPENEQDEEEDE
jgi:hypothetical protein